MSVIASARSSLFINIGKISLLPVNLFIIMNNYILIFVFNPLYFQAITKFIYERYLQLLGILLLMPLFLLVELPIYKILFKIYRKKLSIRDIYHLYVLYKTYLINFYLVDDLINKL